MGFEEEEKVLRGVAEEGWQFRARSITGNSESRETRRNETKREREREKKNSPPALLSAGFDAALFFSLPLYFLSLESDLKSGEP